MQKIGPNGDVTSAVATLDGRSRNKKKSVPKYPCHRALKWRHAIYSEYELLKHPLSHKCASNKSMNVSMKIFVYEDMF